VQAAIDAVRGVPQQVRVSRTADGTRLDFYSPLPGFAERRLALVGDKLPGVRSLFGFLVHDRDAAPELNALQELLWMTPVASEDA
jgi:hypothetical protein